MRNQKKTCAGCQHYDAWWGLCTAPVPLWLKLYDPRGDITVDKNVRMAPGTDAARCRTYRKRRGKG